MLVTSADSTVSKEYKLFPTVFCCSLSWPVRHQKHIHHKPFVGLSLFPCVFTRLALSSISFFSNSESSM